MWKSVIHGGTLKQYVSNSLEETRKIAQQILQEEIKNGELILLKGEMGAGKTSFIQGLGEAIQSRANVLSPTFSKVHVYPGQWTLIHLDLYNVKSVEELEDLGIYDYIEPEEGICVVEWWELYPQLFGGRAHHVEITSKGSQRLIQYSLKEN